LQLALATATLARTEFQARVRRNRSQSQRLFVFDFYIFDGVRPVPPHKPDRDDNSDQHTYPKEQPISWEFDQQEHNYCRSNQKPGRTLEPDHHTNILAPGARVSHSASALIYVDGLDQWDKC
jgi:hypothetical protein